MTRTALVSIFAICVAAGPAVAEETWTIDPAHTHILFGVDHLGFSTTYGQFDDFGGTIVLDRDNLENSQVDVTIQADSIDTNHAERDNHLRSGDFFNVATYPTITFKSTGVQQTGDGTAVITGDLTLLGVTKPVKLNATFNAEGTNAFTNTETIGFSATGQLKRSDFDLGYGLPVIGDEITLRIQTEATPAE